MPRFVLLEHDHPSLHWDLMLEVGEVLRTWRLDAIPRPGCTCHALQLPDHRLIYLDYEGPVSGDRGVVERIAGGEYVWVEDSACRVAILVQGEWLAGQLSLEKGQGGQWEVHASL